MAPKRNPQPPDPRSHFSSAMATAAEVLSGVREDQLDLPTPCPDFDVKGLVNHLLNGPHAVAAMGSGAEFAERAEAIPHDQWRADWDTSAAAVRDVWADDALLSKHVPLPWNPEASGEDLLGDFTCEVVLHTWDLAQATGQWADWKPEVVEYAFRALHEGLPEDRAQIPAFGDVVPVPDDAPYIDQLIGWSGRKP
ncbi:MAG: TIGR03086 family protein [Actinobacteria bacterium]|nr:MAG: TIGR03086 family protein [Actinomycetota bacterium]